MVLGYVLPLIAVGFAVLLTNWILANDDPVFNSYAAFRKRYYGKDLCAQIKHELQEDIATLRGIQDDLDEWASDWWTNQWDDDSEKRDNIGVKCEIGSAGVPCAKTQQELEIQRTCNLYCGLVPDFSSPLPRNLNERAAIDDWLICMRSRLSPICKDSEFVADDDREQVPFTSARY